MTQNKRVIELLEKDGQVSRNQCVRMYPAILRLSARIHDLEAQGWQFQTKEQHGDYFYYLVATPTPQQLTFV